MGLECGGCRRWFHAKCEKLSKKEYEKVCEIEDKIMWHCGECGEILPMVLQENRRLQKELALVKKEICEIKELMAATKGSGSPGSLEKLTPEVIKNLQLEFEIRREEINKIRKS